MNIINIDISKLKSYRNHVFPLYEGNRLDRLVQSVKDMGVLTPIIVRALDFKGNSYEILAGHNRVHACEIAGITEIPAVAVIPKTEQEAELIAIETNMCQRSLDEIPISTKAKAVVSWYNCIKSQGMRTDLLDEIQQLERLEKLNYSVPDAAKKIAEKSIANPDKTEEKSTSDQIEPSFNAREYISEKSGLNAADIQRLVRISKLSDELLEKVDRNKIPYMAAYELTFVPNDTLFVLNIMLDNPTHKITIKGAQRLRYACRNGKVITAPQEIMSLIQGESKAKKDKPISVTLKQKTLDKYFKGVNKKEVAAKVERSLELTEVVIPQILEEKNILSDDYSSIISAALNYYFDERKMNDE